MSWDNRVECYDAIRFAGLDSTKHGIIKLTLVTSTSHHISGDTSVTSLVAVSNGRTLHKVCHYSYRAVAMPHLKVNSSQRFTGVNIDYLDFICQRDPRLFFDDVLANEFSGDVYSLKLIEYCDNVV